MLKLGRFLFKVIVRFFVDFLFFRKLFRSPYEAEGSGSERCAGTASRKGTANQNATCKCNFNENTDWSEK